ncbi:MAG: glycosyltransferase [Candidatus Cloacimonadales bacterium]|nr:glycosyltransferase [Candidatus Cloacimonadales bacterium]
MRILFLSSLFAPFIHDQIISLLSKKEIIGFSNFHYNFYLYLRTRRDRKLYRESELSQIVPGRDKIFYPGLPKDILKCIYPKILYSQIRNLYKNKEFDIIHAHTLLPSGYVAYKLSKLRNVPYIVTTHGADFYKCISHVSKLRNIKPYCNKEISMVREVLQNANSIICVSNKFAEDVSTFCPNAKIQIIPNDYRSDIFFPQDKLLCRKELRIPNNKKIIISVGNFVEVKGHKYILQALPAIIDKHKDILLLLIGGGELKKKYIKTCEQLNLKKHVRIMDRLKHEELAIWYNIADIFVLPSVNETFGVVLLEALACGLPVIATSTSGPSQIISDSIDGLFVPIKNSNAISETVNYLFSNEETLKKMSKNALQNIQNKYSNVTKKIICVYKTSIKSTENNLYNKKVKKK